MKKTYIQRAGAAIALVLGLLISGETKAQLNPLGGIYFQNRYQANPALAGSDSGLTVNLGYRKQWNSIPGAPKTQALTATYGLNEKVGLGLNVYNDEAGLMRRTKVMGSYAYHLPVGAEEQKLSFGLSLGFMNERVGYEDMVGDPNDQNVNRFNQRETFIDGDFGAAYRSNKLTVQAAIPNLKNFFGTDDNANTVDHSLFYTALSYKFYFEQYLDGLGIEPLAAFRGVKGFDNIGDFGANLTFANNAVSLSGMYHTSKSATIGMGVNFRKSISILGIYTTETSALSGYTKGNFEVALKARLF